MSQTISNYVKNLRKDSGLGVEEFARQYGISHAQVSIYESGKVDNFSLLVAANFCNNFGFDADEFLDDFYNDKLSISDISGFKVALENKLNGNSNAYLLNNLYSFFDIFSKNETLDGLKLINENNRSKVFPEFAELSPVASCTANKLKNNNLVYVFYFPYTKVPNNSSKSKYYSSLRGTIMSLIGIDNKTLNCKNFILLTPDYQQYSYFKNQSYFQKNDTNITLVCYRHKKELKYTNIIGNVLL